MSEQLWVLAGVILGAVLGGGAQILADHLRARRDSAVRREQLRREAYVDFVAAIEPARYARMRPLTMGTIIDEHLPGTLDEMRAELKAWTKDLLRNSQELDVAVARVRFVGPANVAAKAAEIEHFIAKRNPGDGDNLEKLQGLTAEFVKVAQPYAGVPAHVSEGADKASSPAPEQG